MGRMLSALLICSLLVCAPLRGDDSNTGDAGAKPASPVAKENTASSKAAKTETNKTDAAKPATDYREEIEELRQLMREQSQQLAEQQKQLTLLREQLSASHTSTASAAPAGAEPATVHVVNGDMGYTVRPAAGTSTDASAAQDKPKTEDGPSSIHYKGINLTPGGFIAAETVSRQRATSADINTPFNSIPYPGNALAHVSENNFTARQSRISLLAETKIGNAKVTGYYEADFLGTGVTSNNRQSNSYVFRQRVIYGQAAFDSGWIFTGGQQWSLLTETRKGITNRQEVLPMTIDPQYQVGFSWARQYGFRVVKDFDGKFALGVSIEAPQSTIGGRGFSLVTTTTVGTATVATTGNTFVDAPGSGGGLFNSVDASGYSVNKAPDIIVKATADPGYGHYELFGIMSTFRNRAYPCGVVGTNANDTAPPATATTITCAVNGSTTPSSVGAFNDTRMGGGIGANMRLPLFAKKLDFALQGMAGDGIGRYGSAQLADLTFRPDGTQALVRASHGLGELVYHVTPKLDIYADFGAEYAWRTAYQGYNSITITKTPGIPATATTLAIPATTTTTFKLNQFGGYGSPFANNSGCSTENPPSNQLTPSGGGTCAGDTRVVMEGTLGIWHRMYQGPKGGLRWGIQYSYFTRNGWSGNNGVPTAVGVSPKGVNNMVWTSFRYYLP